MSFDPWQIISRYFERDPYYLTDHHLNSYNQFLEAGVNDEIGIEYIVKRNNPIKIFKGQTGDSFKHEIYIYLGEERTDEGELVDSGKHIYFGKPILYKKEETDASGEQDKTKYMYPNLARNYNTTYASDIFMDITIIIKEKGEVVFHDYRQNLGIGKLPIMIHSNLCLLNKRDPKVLKQLGECPYDKGGYFIINGKEKVIISQEKKADNMIYITKLNNDKFTYEANLKSVSKEGFQSSRTNNVAIENSGRITVRILGIADRIPLFILFRTLGIQSDKDICKLILNENTDSLTSETSILMQALLPSIRDSECIYTQEAALKYIGLKTTSSVVRKFIINAKQAINNNFLPNYGNNNNYKSFFLGYLVKKLLKTSLAIIPATDRDHYKNKRIDLSGFLINDLYRELFEKFIKNMKLKVDYRYKFDYEQDNKFEDIKELIHDGNLNIIFDKKVIERDLDKSFRMRWGTEASSTEGVVQDINRNTLLGTVSVMRRVTFPFDKTSKADGPRKLHSSQWGYICPSESPDGSNVGIVNNLAVTSSVSSWVNPEGIIECLKGFTDGRKMIPLELITPVDCFSLCKIFINNMWLGVCQAPVELYRTLKLYKHNAIINIQTSIYWNRNENEIYISTEQGRLIRPLIRLTDNKSSLFDDTKEFLKDKKWNDLIFGIRAGEAEREDIKYYPGDYDLDELEKEACSIEYIDSNETEDTLIATNYKNLENPNIKYTHCEIHNSLILSNVANTIPFPQHAQAPRNVYSSHQMKQTVGVFNTNYPSRFETFSHILHYPQKPIVDSKFSKYVFSKNLPSGVNAIVAIASYSGYNQEDSIILNKSSMERGMFKSLYHRSYTDQEEDTNKTGGFKQETSRFCNPEIIGRTRAISELGNKKNYSNLDENGIIPLNTRVTEDDVLIGKFSVSENRTESGEVILDISGKTVNNGTSGIVDKIILVEKDFNLRLAKVRVRKIKNPEIGDKFAARSGQKGTIGMVIPAEDMPFTQDGIVPDIIMNPHAIPSRMTINQLLECILGKAACHYGNIGNCTAFEHSDVSNISDVLEKTGYEKYGNEILYNGITGEQINTQIFFGPTYYQRLKLMVADKVQSRATGPRDYITRQAAAGRSNKGGLRIGEMERDAILSHGASLFLKETTMKRSDDYSTYFNNRNGMIVNDNIYESSNDNINRVDIPYSMKLFIQELQSMSISAKCVLENNENDTQLLQDIIPKIKNNGNMSYDPESGDGEEEEVEGEEVEADE